MPRISMKISLRPTISITIKKSTQTNQSSKDQRLGFVNNHIAHDVLRAAILKIDVEALNAEGPGYRVKDSYNSLLWLVHHMDHFMKVLKEGQKDAKDIEARASKATALANDASKKRDEALQAKSMAEEEMPIKRMARMEMRWRKLTKMLLTPSPYLGLRFLSLKLLPKSKVLPV
ncbi:hypothetical protein COCNU_01G015850 [Cocos nucifera]|uniref:Uncharacterized protein n=1 Tax=Cocos nucifera TaxID=13894 RepID=A0A8K0HVV7_COCNU|nr:hypothetical protein COCNU_01G015850 [Cocos nucifera]